MGCGSSSTATDPNNNVRKDKNEKSGKGQAVKRKGGHEAELTSEPDIEDVRALFYNGIFIITIKTVNKISFELSIAFRCSNNVKSIFNET